jgi:hypothetical protein
MTTPEGRIKDRVKKALNKLGAYYFMPVQRGLGASSLDFICCYEGRFFAIETKVPGKKLSPRQEVVAAAMVHAGAIVMVVRDATNIKYMIKLLKSEHPTIAVHDALAVINYPVR